MEGMRVLYTASQSSVDDAAELDFLSASFDPLRALSATFPLTLPNPRALPLDNLSKCRGILPPEDPEWRIKDPASHQLLKVCCTYTRHADPGIHSSCYLCWTRRTQRIR